MSLPTRKEQGNAYNQGTCDNKEYFDMFSLFWGIVKKECS